MLGKILEKRVFNLYTYIIIIRRYKKGHYLDTNVGVSPCILVNNLYFKGNYTHYLDLKKTKNRLTSRENKGKISKIFFPLTESI